VSRKNQLMDKKLATVSGIVMGRVLKVRTRLGCA